jgi:uncharacterized protein
MSSPGRRGVARRAHVSGASILWRGLYLGGHEYARIESRDPGWHLEGVAVFSHESAPCRLEYDVACTDSWVTTGARVGGWIGERRVEVVLTASEDRRWRLNGAERPAVDGCTDVDLNFSPSTNTLPIRRLSLEIGETRTVRAAWLRFPSLELEPLEQSYSRLAADRYRYESGGGRFTSELAVDGSGVVRDYPGIWVAD